MEIIIVNRPLEPLEVQHIHDKMFSENKDISLFLNVTSTNNIKLPSKGVFDLSADEKREINYELFRHILNFGEIKIDGTPVTDLLMFEKASIWHYQKFRSYFYLRNLTYEIRLIEKALKQYQRIDFYGTYSQLASYPFNSDNVKIHLKQPKKLKKNYLALLNYMVFFGFRILVSFFNFHKLKKSKNIVIDHSIKQPCLNLITLKPEYGNYNLAYLFEQLDADFLILDDFDIPKFHEGSTFNFNTDLLKSNGNRLFGEFILFKGLISMKGIKQLKVWREKLLLTYDQIDSKLHNPFDKIINQFLRSLHNTSSLYLFKYLAYKRFFRKNKFLTISTIDENSPRIKSILDAAKSNAIKTFGIQHGIIHDLQPTYHFTVEDMNRKVTADCTFVWGKYWESKLTNQGNYPKDSIIVTGMIRTDIIPRLLQMQTSIKSASLENKKVAVYASQPQHDPIARRNDAFEVFKAVKNIENCQLVLKPHPAEMNDFDYYHQIAKEAGYNELIINGHTDLYMIISQSDIILTSFSTVGLESVFFRKPLIIVDPLKQDIQGYFRDGIAFQASNSEEINYYVQKLISGELTINDKAYDNYTTDQVFKIDGKVSKRIINNIRNKN
ncbi:MAG: UDP-N-acetylglucosamine 2-epimerase [Bacteroidales bacterium]